MVSRDEGVSRGNGGADAIKQAVSQCQLFWSIWVLREAASRLHRLLGSEFTLTELGNTGMGQATLWRQEIRHMRDNIRIGIREVGLRWVFGGCKSTGILASCGQSPVVSTELQMREPGAVLDSFGKNQDDQEDPYTWASPSQSPWKCLVY